MSHFHAGKIFLTLFFIVPTVLSESHTFKITDRFVTNCPQVKTSNAVVVSQTNFTLSTYYHTASKNRVNIIDTDGSEQYITFPGCYDATINLNLKKPIANPYIEVFLKLGADLPCRNEKDGVGIAVGDANCPKSKNRHLQSMIGTRETCRYCNLCANIENRESEVKQLQVLEETAGSICNLDGSTPYKLKLRLCTPSGKELQGTEGIVGDILRNRDIYLDILRQGYLEMVMHFLDRKNPPAKKASSFCKGLAWTNPKAYMRYCEVQDVYSACLYMSSAFQVSSGD